MHSASRLSRALLPLLLLLAAVTACERVVTVTAPAAEIRLVVEARLERLIDRRSSPPQRIRLTTTQGAFSDEAPPPARGAQVRVLNAAGTATSFVESSTDPGLYLAATLMPLTIGQSLTLQITWQGDVYSARETMLRAVPIDTLLFTDGPSIPGLPVGLRGSISFQDPADVANFYLWEQWVDGVRQVSRDSGSFSRAVLPDDILNGSMILEFSPYRGVVVRPGQRVRIRQYSISQQAFRFYDALSKQTDNTGSPFGVPSSSVRGNVANITRPSRLALGYFIASEYAEVERVVP